MRSKTIILLLVVGILLPGFAGAASEKDFVNDKGHILNIKY